jgi:putative ABC transport system permease protein
MRTFDEIAARSTAQRRWSALLLVIFAALGIVLAAAGIYGMTSHMVALRTGEISIRMSLGARRVTVLGEVLRDALFNAGIGLTAGLIGGLAVARILQSLLLDLEPADPVTFGGTALLVVVIAVLAALSPALRAMRVDPVQALRQA